mmetsp:Transcript_86758/g.280913  ORF Transcript_86758/g.280913 Transcript_86758/m.280913 type:complete len:92 (+) Transcript_86758:1570-1845(+)
MPLALLLDFLISRAFARPILANCSRAGVASGYASSSDGCDVVARPFLGLAAWPALLAAFARELGLHGPPPLHVAGRLALDLFNQLRSLGIV